LACSFCGGHEGGATPDTDAGSDGPAAGRWQDLYASYFGPDGQANCSQGTGACHSVSSDLGVATSGFVCGPTSDSCWHGMNQGLAGHAALVPAGGASDAAQTLLWAALYKAKPSGGTVSNNMPQNLTYMFTSADLARIAAWIQAGAPEN
jgi:hypothetical protein